MIIVAVKLFSILMNLDKIVLQVAVNILTKLSIQYPVHLFIILVIISIKAKTFTVRNQNDNEIMKMF